MFSQAEKSEAGAPAEKHIAIGGNGRDKEQRRGFLEGKQLLQAPIRQRENVSSESPIALHGEDQQRSLEQEGSGGNRRLQVELPALVPVSPVGKDTADGVCNPDAVDNDISPTGVVQGNPSRYCRQSPRPEQFPNC